jgi:hypothetical protein
LTAFQSAAARDEPGPATSLSFANLQALLSEDDQDGLPEPLDPWDDSDTEYVVTEPDRHPRATAGCVDLIYDFSLARYEPNDLLIRVSKVFPTLSFVLGWVAPSNDEHTSDGGGRGTDRRRSRH